MILLKCKSQIKAVLRFSHNSLKLKLEKTPRILICPLNWGLGHATRVVPIIHEIIQLKYDVIIAADGIALDFLKQEFPSVKVIQFKSYQVKYSKKSNQVFKMFFLLLRLIYWTIKEHIVLKKLIAHEKVNVVISDNRFGLWNKSIYTIFITHQLRVIFPGILKLFEPAYQYLLKKIIEQYNECWIPDFNGKVNLSGQLSHLKKTYPNTYFIGPLSRFSNKSNNNSIEFEYDFLFILSGPEPQRSIFESICIQSVKNSKQRIALVRGINTDSNKTENTNITFFGMLNSNNLLELIQRSEYIVCRSGYSSVMDLVALKKRAILIPTPGQTEQEYLAKYLDESAFFPFQKQNDFSIENAIKKLNTFSTTPDLTYENYLIHRIVLLDKIFEKGNKKKCS